MREKTMSLVRGRVIKDITGMRIGSLIVIGRDKTKDRNYWLVRCDCGNIKSIFRGHLVAGRIDNCGCKTFAKRQKVKQTHGESKSRLFKIWIGMHTRCYNKTAKSYEVYGGRGIKICSEWMNDYTVFRDWALSSGYDEQKSIDRIDVNGDYDPSNCRWVDQTVQANNTTKNHRIFYNGKSHTLAEWARIKGFPVWTIQNRMKYGWSIEKIMETPVKTVTKHQECRESLIEKIADYRERNRVIKK
jgi:hypothetical protein